MAVWRALGVVGHRVTDDHALLPKQGELSTMSPDYDDTATGPIGSPAYSASTPEPDTTEPAGDERAPRNGDGVNWPTVLMAGGISAIISALVVTIGVVGLLLSDIGRDNNAASNSAQPTVVNLGSAQSQGPQASAPGAAPRATAPGAPAAGAPAVGEPAGPPGEGSSADLPAGGGASGGGVAPGAAPQPAPEVPAAPQQTQQQAQTPTSRPTPTVGQLQGDLNALVGGGSAAQKGQRLEGGQRAATQAQPIVLLLQRFKPLGFTYRVVGPVSVTGNTAKATLELRSPGYQPARMPVYWVWKDGQWKLSNRSICDIGSYAQIPCSL
ncbi:hypothetical protein [Gordonia sp. OPL2]|uniref:hypothetical protein n=1 Tax=Gordonia sp. OPL2 TaxID=2486274 RepID=UPI001654DCAB|nr:hypothetical protein [Gordonia sp. OPL2]ROZ99342.1 hypothetical protein EEB19_11630 [Gordonia sp. OPL2]